MKQRKRMIKKIMWMFVLMFLAAGISQRETNVVYAAEEISVIGEKIDCITAEEDVDAGISYGSASAHKVSVKKGNYVKWIDRLNIPDYGKKLYDKLVEGADNDGKSDILIDGNTSKLKVTTLTCSKKELDDVIDDVAEVIYAVGHAFEQDHPEVFWLSGTYNCYYQYKDMGNNYEVTYYLRLKHTYKGTTVDIRGKGYQSESKVKAAIKERDQIVKKIMDGIPKKADVVEKLRYFNEYLVLNNQYCTGDLGQRTSHISITALKGAEGEKGPVCESYAKAFKVLCDEAGIPCVIVDGADHEWNYVKVDGKWYAVDVTWNDPTGGGKDGAVSGSENENYFLVGADTKLYSNSAETFIQMHPNECEFQKLNINSGPSLNKTAYPVSAIEKVELNAKEIFYGDNVAPTVTVTTKKLAKGRVTYQWYNAEGTKLKDYTGKMLLLYPKYNVDAKAGKYYCEISYNGVVQKKVDVVVKPKVVTPAVYDLIQKTYDGSKEWSVTSGQPLLQGDFFRGDDVYFDTTKLVCTFEDANAGKDKKLQISNIVLAGKDASNYTLSAKQITGTADIKPVEILPTIDEVQVTLENSKLIYNGEFQTIKISKVIVNGQELPATAYTLENASKKDADSYIANLVFQGNYEGEYQCFYEIQPIKIEGVDVQVILENPVLEFNGKIQGAEISKVLVNGTEVSSECYVLKNDRHLIGGEYTANLHFSNNYEGAAQYEYEIIYTQEQMNLIYAVAAGFAGICVLFIFLKIKKRKIKK